MTTRTIPGTPEATMRLACHILGMAGAVAVTGKDESYLRKVANPNLPNYKVQFEDAVKLDAALAAQGSPPLFRLLLERMGRSEDVPEVDADNAVKEIGALFGDLCREILTAYADGKLDDHEKPAIMEVAEAIGQQAAHLCDGLKRKDAPALRVAAE